MPCIINQNVILHIKYVSSTLEHHVDIFQYFDLKYCWLLSSSTLTLVVVSQGNQIVKYLRPVTDVYQLSLQGAEVRSYFVRASSFLYSR